MIEPILALAGLMLSAFFSGSEIAFVQANPLQMEVWQKQGRSAAEKTATYLAEPERFLTTVLVGTNLANVLTSSFATVALLRYGVSETLTILVITVTILLFGEIIPKTFFQERPNSLALGVTPLLRLAEIFLTPLVKLVKTYSRIISPEDSRQSSGLLSREDLKILFKEVETGEELEEDEKEVISRIFEFGSRPVSKAMTPRPDIVAVTSSHTVDQAIQVMSDTGLSKLPAYTEDLDSIVGIVFLHDLFTRPETLSSIMKRPLFIADSMSANRALEELKDHKSSIAIVAGRDGKTAGLVTVEDLVEELFGEFEDVFDIEGRKITRIPDGSLVVDSLVEVEELRQQFGFQIPKGDYETIGGFLLWRLGRIPRAGEMLNFDAFRIKVLLATPSRLKRLHLIKKQ